MTTALAYLALLATVITMVWLAARRAGRMEKELDYVKKENKQQKASNEIVGRYVNLSSYELSERVLEKRKNSRKRMSDKN